MLESPRTRRLRSDYRALEKLRSESSILDFAIPPDPTGAPPEVYYIHFYGRGLFRPLGTTDVLVREHHEVCIRLGAAYPRMMPELSWKTPIFHPNISSSGVVCLGGYGTHWVPSLNLDELCVMLWDVVRYANFDVGSPYNREAAYWARNQAAAAFPVDVRPLRDRVAGVAPANGCRKPPIVAQPPTVRGREVAVAETVDVMDAEIVDAPYADILYID
jgi:hypothetical protein